MPFAICFSETTLVLNAKLGHARYVKTKRKNINLTHGVKGVTFWGLIGHIGLKVASAN